MLEYAIPLSFFLAGLLNVFGITDLKSEQIFLCSLGCLVLSIGGCYNKLKEIFNMIGLIIILIASFLTKETALKIVNVIKEITGFTDSAILMFSMAFTILSIMLSKQNEEINNYKQSLLCKKIMEILDKIEKN